MEGHGAGGLRRDECDVIAHEIGSVFTPGGWGTMEVKGRAPRLSKCGSSSTVDSYSHFTSSEGRLLLQ